MINVHIGKAVADFLETRLEELCTRLLAQTPAQDHAIVRPILEPWLQALLHMMRGQSYRVHEWSAILSDNHASINANLQEAVGHLIIYRKTLQDFCCGNIAGVEDQAIYALFTEIIDLHLQQAVQHYVQRERDSLSTEVRRRRVIMETMGRPFALLDGRGLLVMGNSEFAACLNSSPEALPGLDFVALCEEDIAQEFRRILRQRRPQFQQQKFTGRLTAGEGPAKIFDFIVQPMFDADGRRDSFAVSLEHVGAHGLAPDEVLQYLLRQFIDRIPLPVQVINRAGQIVHENPMADTVSWPDKDADAPYCCYLANQRGEKCPCETVFETAIPFSDEIRLEGRNSTRWFQVTIMPLCNPDGAVYHAACGILDVTDRKHLQKRMENQILTQQRTSLVSQIALTVAHQLRNPLGVIIGFAELLNRGLPSEQINEVVDRILRNGLRCKEIVDDLLNFGQGLPLDRVPVDVCAVVRESVQPMLTSAQYGRVEWRLPTYPVWVECVPVQLAQMLISLIDNALCFAQKRVLFEISHRENKVYVAVADDGPGVPTELSEQVFEPFFTTRRGEGSVGLGLSLARSAARDYGGDIRLNLSKESELSGAWFVLELPEVSDKQIPMRPDDREVGGKPVRRVLIVDDEPDLLEMLATALHMRGYEADQASAGAEALARIRAQQYDALVLDLQLPGMMSGRDLYAQILSYTPAMADRTLIITADTLNFETQRFLQTARCPSLEKPFLISDFIEMLERIFKKTAIL